MDEQRRKEALDWFRQQLEYAQECLDRIAQGRDIFHRDGGSEAALENVTEEHRQKCADTVERMKKYIELYEKV